MAHDILIVDDEPDIRALIEGILSDEGYGTAQAANSDQALAAFRARRPSLVILDIWLQNSAWTGSASSMPCTARSRASPA
jgi:two-component system nitrogen regulation response regulator NtrX